MAEYIEREALIKELNSKGVVHQMDNENFHYKQGYLTGLLKAVIVAKTLPTADVVEVVRCRECKYLYCLSAIDRRFYCKHYPQGLSGINIVEDNPFCSYGERKESEVDTE